MSKRALTYIATERIRKLAKPKHKLIPDGNINVNTRPSGEKENAIPDQVAEIKVNEERIAELAIPKMRLVFH